MLPDLPGPPSSLGAVMAGRFSVDKEKAVHYTIVSDIDDSEMISREWCIERGYLAMTRSGPVFNLLILLTRRNESCGKLMSTKTSAAVMKSV